MKRLLLLLPLVALFFAGCEKEITVDLPEAEQEVVITGTIEPGRAPIVVVARTQGYFDPTDLNSLLAMYNSDATVTVDNGDGPVTLDVVCGSAIPDELLADAAQLIGLEPAYVEYLGMCVYTKTDGSLLGEVGRSYTLSVQADGKSLTSATSLYPPEPLDSVWFKLAEQNPDDDSLGFIWQTTSDPPGLGNHYRWMARRINEDPETGQAKDPFFIAPFFAAFEDKYIDGLTFDWSINRGTRPYSTDTDDENEERGYFKRGDTVVVKFSAIGRPEYDFYNSLDNNVTSQGDLFSNPANVKDNIEGGLGIWAGWSPWIDTLVCEPQ